MTKFVKYHFNLIEIALAMCVIAIGLTGVMSLFALGAKSNRQSIANNCMADISEYLVASFRSLAIAEATKESMVPANGFLSKLNISDLEKVDEDKKATKKINLNDLLEKWKTIKVNDLSNPGQNWKISIGNDLTNAMMCEYAAENTKGVYLFRHITDSNVLFSSIIYCWVEKIPHPTLAGKTLPYQYAAALCFEITWPADFEYADREKSYYRFELFNEKFEPTPTN
jgi:Tfp pilus assembly protein PilV